MYYLTKEGLRIAISNTIGFAWGGEPNADYSLIATPDLSDWSTTTGAAFVVTNLISSGVNLQTIVPAPDPSAISMFFRVRQN